MAAAKTSWWNSKVGSDVHEEIHSFVAIIRDESRQRRITDNAYAYLYHDDSPFSSPYAAAVGISGMERSGSVVKFNVSKNVVDTITAKIAKNFPSIKVAIGNVDWSSRRKGKNLGKFLNGKFTNTKFRQLSPIIFRDACIRGTGIVKVTHEFGEILTERVLKEDILIDPIESRFGNPRQMHQIYLMSREVLVQLFPKKRKEILSAEAEEHTNEEFALDSWTSQTHSNEDIVRVVESWHLPSAPGAEDGNHTITLPQCTLLHERFEKDNFPFAFIHWSKPDKGFWGNGLIEELCPIQLEIDMVLNVIQEAMRMGGKPSWWIKRSSKIINTHINNAMGSISEYSDTPPHYFAPTPINPQWFTYLDMLYDKAYELPGLSKLSAQSKTPARVGDSAPAIQALYDIETERFSQPALSYGDLFLSVAEHFIDVAKDIYSEDKEYSGNWIDKTLIQKIKWKDVDLDKDQFELSLEAVSIFPDTISGKLSTIQELSNIGVLSPQLVSAALESPDTERVFSSINAAYDNVEWVIEQLEDVDVPEPYPEPFHNLPLAIEQVKAAYNDFQANDAPEEVLERVRAYLSKANTLANPPTEAPPTPPGAPMPPGLPPGAPMLPPEGLPPTGAPIPPLPMEGAGVPPIAPDGLPPLPLPQG